LLFGADVMPAKRREVASVPALDDARSRPVRVLTPPERAVAHDDCAIGCSRNVGSRDPQLGPSCDDVLDHPSERKDSSDRHSQRDHHDWENDED
jgi:hypothetical protein